jgi:hypothetical protein
MPAFFFAGDGQLHPCAGKEKSAGDAAGDQEDKRTARIEIKKLGADRVFPVAGSPQGFSNRRAPGPASKKAGITPGLVGM